MSDTKALEVAAIADGLRKVAVEMNDMSRRMSAYAVKRGDAEFAKHAQELAGAAMIALHWADAIEKRRRPHYAADHLSVRDAEHERVPRHREGDGQAGACRTDAGVLRASAGPMSFIPRQPEKKNPPLAALAGPAGAKQRKSL